MKVLVLTFSLLVATGFACAQWTLQNSGATADLRGIAFVGNGVAWASGNHGTVLRTVDMGKTWTRCATPPDGGELDFRGVQAFDATTAFVMASGKGPLSAVYKTVDGCRSWSLSFPDGYGADGFFDALLFINERNGILFGDPTSGRTQVEEGGDFRLRQTTDAGMSWVPVIAADNHHEGHGLHATASESAFAASNSSVAVAGAWFWLATSSGRVSRRRLWTDQARDTLPVSAGCAGQTEGLSMSCGLPWTDFEDSFAPTRHDAPSAGIFSIAFRTDRVGVVVGGDYRQPEAHVGTAAYSGDGGATWKSSVAFPHGYRSSVAYEMTTHVWVTVGPNGTDISRDDGENWQALKPGAGDDPEADRHWNALSLPFVVGPKGRIGILRGEALRGHADSAAALRNDNGLRNAKRR